jgi:hypothetical protein
MQVIPDRIHPGVGAELVERSGCFIAQAPFLEDTPSCPQGIPRGVGIFPKSSKTLGLFRELAGVQIMDEKPFPQIDPPVSDEVIPTPTDPETPSIFEFDPWS